MKKYTIDGYPLWSETKVKVKVNETKSKSRFFRTFIYFWLCLRLHFSFWFKLLMPARIWRRAFLNEAKSKSMLNATNNIVQNKDCKKRKSTRTTKRTMAFVESILKQNRVNTPSTWTGMKSSIIHPSLTLNIEFPRLLGQFWLIPIQYSRNF